MRATIGEYWSAVTLQVQKTQKNRKKKASLTGSLRFSALVNIVETDVNTES